MRSFSSYLFTSPELTVRRCRRSLLYDRIEEPVQLPVRTTLRLFDERPGHGIGQWGVLE
jgi:hypothetical protein